MMNLIRNFARDESGASAAEYALILAIISGGIILAAVFLGDQIAQAVADVGCLIQNSGAANGDVADLSGTTITCS